MTTTRHRNLRPLLTFLGVVLILAIQSPPCAAVINSTTWAGAGDDDNWSTVANWTGGNIPKGVAATTNMITFSGTDNRHTNVMDVTGLNSTSGGLAARFTTANWHISGLDNNQVRIPSNMGLTNNLADSVVVWDVPIYHSSSGTIFFHLQAYGSHLVLPNLIHSTGTGRVVRKRHGDAGVGKLSLLCPTNTFMGRCELGSGISEFVKIANAGEPSSLGTWAVANNNVYSVYVGNAGTQYATYSSYIGTEDGQTDRRYYFGLRGPARFEFNNSSPNNSSLTFNGDWEFAPNTANNSLILGGTSLGTNHVNGRLFESGAGAATLDFGLDVAGPSTWVLNGSYELQGALRFLSGTQYVGAAFSTPAWQTADYRSLCAPITIVPGAVLNAIALPYGLAIGQSGDQTFRAGRTTDPGTDFVGDLDIGWYGAVDINAIGVPATLKIDGNLRSVSGKGIIYADLSDQPATAGMNDLIEVTGNLDLTYGLTTVNVNPYAGALQANSPYTLFKYGGSLSGDAGNLNVPPPSRAFNAVVSTATAGEVRVTFTPNGQSSANLVWQGLYGWQWDVNASQTWLNGATTDVFQQLDNVKFDDSSSQFDVTVVGIVAPASILVDTTNAYTLKGSGSISGGAAGSITKKGSGSLRIETANNLSSPITLSAGALVVANSAALGTNDITLGDVNTGTNDIALLLENAAQRNKMIVTGEGTGGVTIGRSGGSGQSTMNGDIVLNGDLVVTNVGPANAGQRMFVYSYITGAGNLTFDGSGYTSLSQMETNDFVGNVIIQGAGNILQVDTAGRGLPPTCNVEIREGASLQPYGSQAINSLAGSGIVRGVAGSHTLTVGAANGDGLFTGKLQYNLTSGQIGSVNLRKAGTGTQILTGDSSTSAGANVSGSIGSTVVAEGVLAVNNEEGSGLGSGNLTVQTAGTLAGHGAVILTNSSATIEGTLSVGNAGDTNSADFTLTIEGTGTMTFTNGALEVDLFTGAGAGDNSADAAAADVLVANCPVTLDAGATLKVNNPKGLTGWAIGDKWKVATWASAPTGTFTALDLPNLGAGQAWDVSKLYTDGTIEVAAAAVQTTIQIELLNATTIRLIWTGGTLQSAQDVAGTYTDIPEANSPWDVTVGTGPVFYRVKH